MNFIVPQIEAEDLAKLLHESCRSVTANYIEWDKMDDKMQKVFMTQAKSALAHYCIAEPEDIEALDESRDCARRDCLDAQGKLRKCHAAMVGVIGAETNEEIKEMKGALQMISMLPGMTGSAATKEILKLIAMMDTLFDTGYHSDGTHPQVAATDPCLSGACLGDTSKSCVECADCNTTEIVPVDECTCAAGVTLDTP